jgi:aminopeptidase
MRVPQRDDVLVAAEDVGEPTLHVAERKALVGRHDLLGVALGLAEDELHRVVAERSVEGTAGRGRRDKVELAADVRTARAETGTGLVDRVDGRPPATGNKQRKERHRKQDNASHVRQSRFPDMTASIDRLADYARLAVRVGLNLQPGQVLAINGLLEHAPLARAVTKEAYTAGAKYVDVLYADQHVRRAHIQLAGDDGLAWSPPWLVKRLDDLGESGGALLGITGNPEPELFADLDGSRVGRAQMRAVAEASLRLTDGLCNWSIVAYPNEGWAQTMFGEPDLERLWDAVATTVRLDEPDPVAAWQTHIDNLIRRADALNARRFDALRYRGPGTDLTIGLHPDSTWLAARDEIRGIEYVPNMPTEEVFTTPDARRVDGTVRATYPLQIQGTIVRGLEVRFEGGRAVHVRADEGEQLMQTHVATDAGAASLGEIALVDSASRVGKTGLIFYNTLFDENAAAHIAFGMSILQGVPGASSLTPEERLARGVNHSSIHTDFMIGSPELDVWGVDKDGAESPILQKGDWVLS